MPLSEAAQLSGYTPEYLNSLSRKGTLRAKKIGRNWHTTHEWVSEFMAAVPGKKKIEIPEEKPEAKKDIPDWEDFEGEGDDEEELDEKEGLLTLEKKRTSFDRKKILAGISSIVVVMPIVFALASFTRFTAQKMSGGTLSVEDVNFFDSVDENKIINENEIFGTVLAEEDSNLPALEKNSGIVLASENYKARELSVGGATIILASAENLPLEISDVRAESFVSGKKDEVKVVVSWRTNKPAISEISYSKNNGQNLKNVPEDSYGFAHSIVMAGLEGRTSYVYSVEARDKWGSENNSDYFGIYTASKPVSVFDMIAKAFGDVFGWAVNK